MAVPLVLKSWSPPRIGRRVRVDLQAHATRVGAELELGRLSGRVAALREAGVDALHAHDRGEVAGRRGRASRRRSTSGRNAPKLGAGTCAAASSAPAASGVHAGPRTVATAATRSSRRPLCRPGSCPSGPPRLSPSQDGRGRKRTIAASRTPSPFGLTVVRKPIVARERGPLATDKPARSAASTCTRRL